MVAKQSEAWVMTESMQRLSRVDWIVEALREAKAVGIRGVKVERLAQSLGVTKGSFYWHFKSRGGLLQAILEYWSTDLVERIEEEHRFVPDEPLEELKWMASRVITEQFNEHDQAIRTWAMFDPAVAEVVRGVDESRLEYKRNLFLRLGFDACEADLRSRMAYYYVIGEDVVGLDRSNSEKLERIKARYDLLGAG